MFGGYDYGSRKRRASSRGGKRKKRQPKSDHYVVSEYMPTVRSSRVIHHPRQNYQNVRDFSVKFKHLTERTLGPIATNEGTGGFAFPVKSVDLFAGWDAYASMWDEFQIKSYTVTMFRIGTSNRDFISWINRDSVTASTPETRAEFKEYIGDSNTKYTFDESNSARNLISWTWLPKTVEEQALWSPCVSVASGPNPVELVGAINVIYSTWDAAAVALDYRFLISADITFRGLNPAAKDADL